METGKEMCTGGNEKQWSSWHAVKQMEGSRSAATKL